jgi:hypothetical protein
MRQNKRKESAMNHDRELERLARDAQATADRTRAAMAVFNLNRSGRRLLVIRDADSFAGENRLVAGPFAPQSKEA